jgi:hypothetical protein
VRLMTSSRPPLVASQAASMGDRAMVTPSLPQPVEAPVEPLMLVEHVLEVWDAPVLVMLGADGAS